jgi:signal peptidase II
MVFIILGLVLIDQVIKFILLNTMNFYDTITIVDNFFNIKLVKNTGAAFSFLESNNTVLIIITLLILSIIIYLIVKDKFNHYEKIVISIIMGGIIGNLIDRIIYGGVIDYLSFKLFNSYMPIFNFADIVIVLGTILLGYFIIREELW